MKFGQFMYYYHIQFLIKKLVPGLFNFQGILCKKESEKVSVLIWTNFYSFAYTYLRNLLQKFHFTIDAVLKGALSGLGQFLVAESLLEMIKNAFYFTAKVLLVLKIFQFLS